MKHLIATVLLALIALTGLSGCGEIYSDSECHSAYVNDYVDYGTVYDMGEEAYCDNLNDTSYLPDEMP